MTEFDPVPVTRADADAASQTLWLDPAFYEMLAIVGLILIVGAIMSLVFRRVTSTDAGVQGEPAAMTGEGYSGMGFRHRGDPVRKRSFD